MRPMAIIILLYNLTILAGTAYLIQVYDWNPWWFAFSLLLLMTMKVKEND